MSRLTTNAIQEILTVAKDKGERPDLSGVRLDHADLSRIDFSETDLSEVNFEGANLIEANLSQANLSQANLSQVDLIGANLARANLSGANLSNANLIGANLAEANLSNVNLSRADLSGVNLSAVKLDGANLNRAELIGTNLMSADLSQSDLSGADLSGANMFKVDLREANLSGARLIGADLSRAILGYSNLADIDLRQTNGLNYAHHQAPSMIDARTLYRSRGFIPETFLRGVGVPDDLIHYLASLNDDRPHYFSCFISYASQNDRLAIKLFEDLQGRGVRCWHAAEDLKTNPLFNPLADDTIRVCDKILLLFSKHAINSVWLAQEVEAALSRERKLDQIVLFPICLDESLLTTEAEWVEPIRNNRNLHDFTEWRTDDAYQKSFDRLLRHLKARHE